jgi:hypothetical protein
MAMVLTKPSSCATAEESPQESPQESHQQRDATKKKSFSWNRLGLLLLFLLLFPAVPLSLSVIFGGFLALVEKASFLGKIVDGFKSLDTVDSRREPVTVVTVKVL